MKKNSSLKRRSTLLLVAISSGILLVVFQQVYNLHSITRKDIDTPVVSTITTDTTQLHPEALETMILRDDNNFTGSACLLVADDNHYLIEWLAFHYHALPLRYLVIASDPRARTSPDWVLERWNKFITIVRWEDHHFLPKRWLHQIPSENDPIAKLIKHRERQRHFYPACFQFLKQAQRRWVTVIDVDEFAIQNTHYENDTQTFPTLLQAIQHQFPSNTSCITMPRLRFGNHEDANSTERKLAPPGFQDQDFLTYRFRWRAGLLSRHHNKLPKSMIHVGKITNFSRQDTDAHRPVRSACPRRNLYTLPKDSPFVVHHYVGSRQQFRFRQDARDGTNTRSETQLNNYNQIHEDYDLSACAWIPQFVKQVGNQTAETLLEGVGNVDYTPLILRR